MKKKTLFTLAVAALASTAYAVPEQNSGYAGTEVGWSSFHKGINQLDSKKVGHENGYGINRNSVNYGVYGGYQLFSNGNVGLAAELGYNYYGRVRGNELEERTFKHSAHGVQMSLKPQVNVAPNLDIYGKTGIALIRNDYKFYGEGLKKFHTTKPSLVLGVGVEYGLTDNLSARVEYNWVSRAGNYSKATRKAGVQDHTKYNPDIHAVSAGLTYRFGNVKLPAILPILDEPTPAPTVKNISLNSDVSFDFGKENLKPEARNTINAFVANVRNEFEGSPALTVAGHTDRIGKAQANVKLSQRRAEAVANHIVQQGVPAETLTAVGYGSSSPVTGNTCDAVKDRKALIACLAPDRRVDITVEGKSKAK